MRWDLLDHFETLKKGVRSRAVKSFTGSEDFFDEHFPGKKRVPEPLMIEMIAQTGGVLLGLGVDFKKEVILAKIASARFSRPVAPPCQFEIETQIEDAREEGAWIAGVVRLGNEVVAEAKILLVTMENLDGRKNIVFSDTFLKHFDVYRIAKNSEALV